MGFLNKAQILAGGGAMDLMKVKQMLEPGEELIETLQVTDFGIGNYDLVMALTNKRIILADAGIIFKVNASIPLNEANVEVQGIARRALISVNGRRFRIGIAAQGRDFIAKLEQAKANL